MTVLAAAWALAVLWGALLLLPVSERTRERLQQLRPEGRRRRSQPVEQLGRCLRSLVGRPPDAAADRRAAAVTLALLAGAAVSPVVALLAATVTWLVLRRRAARHRQLVGLATLAELPEAVDLFALAASAGLSVRQAVEEVAPRLRGPIGSALSRVVKEVRLGVEVPEALEGLTRPPEGEPLRLLVRPLVDSLRYGSALGSALEKAAAAARGERRRQAEASARRVPLRLLFPLTLCVLPAFVLLTIVPTVAQALDVLQF